MYDKRVSTKEARNYGKLPNITGEHANRADTPPRPGVCLTPKCFPAWSEARGLKSARLSRIGYIPWPALLRPFVHPLREARKSVIIVIGEPRKGRKSWKSILFLASDPDIG